jgi:TRAP-type uncharacterized transport system, fused permease components
MLTNVESWPVTIIAIITAVIGVFGLSIATEGFIVAPVPFWGRLLAFAGAVLLIFPGIVTDATGFALLGLVIVYNLKFQKKTTPPDA